MENKWGKDGSDFSDKSDRAEGPEARRDPVFPEDGRMGDAFKSPGRRDNIVIKALILFTNL